jgi:hypothetical protein
MGAEIYVCNIVQTDSGETVVIAVPNNRRAVRIGDVFILAYSLSRKDIFENTINPSRLNQRKICLQVQKIVVFRQEVTVLSHGVTGGLYFSGEGIELISSNMFMRTD